MWQPTIFLASGIATTLSAIAVLTHDLSRELRHADSLQTVAACSEDPVARRWRTGLAFTMLAWSPLLTSLGLFLGACHSGHRLLH